MNKIRLYWFLQVAGWSMYGALYFIVALIISGNDVNPLIYTVPVFEALVLFFITIQYRQIIIKYGWLQLAIPKVIVRILSTVLLLSLPIYPFKILYSIIIGIPGKFAIGDMIGNTLAYFVFIFLWTLFYFLFHYFERYNQSLKYEATMREVELAHLKSQLNPHFIFNALNSIRALVDENPNKSKTAITQLSNILRTSLESDRRKLTKFEDELNTVKDYLSLESTRYEERLTTRFDIHTSSDEFLVPPLMLQTLVENGIKHGISNLKEGGIIKLTTFVEEGLLHIQIRNSGQLNSNQVTGPGFGIKNTIQRLKLLYGDKAGFKIFNENDHTVLTVVTIPIIETYESVNS